MLRYLEEPLVQQELTSADRRALERFCDRLTEIVPVMSAVLTHGDLWSGNLLSRDGRIAVIDPAVSYTWAEVDLSMLWCCQRPAASDRFFDVYQELNPSPPGWAERMPFLHVRELLSAWLTWVTPMAARVACAGSWLPSTPGERRRVTAGRASRGGGERAHDRVAGEILDLGREVAGLR